MKGLWLFLSWYPAGPWPRNSQQAWGTQQQASFTSSVHKMMPSWARSFLPTPTCSAEHPAGTCLLLWLMLSVQTWVGGTQGASPCSGLLLPAGSRLSRS